MEEHWSSDTGVDFLEKWFGIIKIYQSFRTRSPVTIPDIDGWNVRALIVPLFFYDNTELHTLIRKRLSSPTSLALFTHLLSKNTDGLLMVLQKPDGVIRPILCGEVWRRCFTSLAVNVTPIHDEVAKLFTSSHDNFIQTTGIRDGVSHFVKILTCFYDNLDVSDPTDPKVIIKIDVTNAFNSTDRDLTLDVLSGHASRDYACGLKIGDLIPTCDNLSFLNFRGPGWSPMLTMVILRVI